MINIVKCIKIKRSSCCLLLFISVLIGCQKQDNSSKNAVPETTKPKLVDIQENESESAAKSTESKTYVAPKNIVIYDLDRYQINDNRDLVFVSVSETYPLSEHPDSLAIPDISEKETKDRTYFILDRKYKERFYHRTKISKSDTLFIYDYEGNNFLILPLTELKIAAVLSPYASPEDDLSQVDYMIGFEINNKLLSKFKDSYFHHTVAYIGKENPFVKGQMKPIIWEKMKPNNFPKVKMKAGDSKFIRDKKLGEAYKYENDSLQYFIQDYLGEEMNSARHLVVLNAKTNALVFEEFFFEEDGIELAKLNYSKEGHNYFYQWTGNLFKAKPPVVFGFISLSFGCPHLSFLDKGERSIYISCDNRH